MANNYLRATVPRYYKLTLPDFSAGVDASRDPRLLPITRAEQSFNFCLETGALTQGWGLSGSDITDARRVWRYRRYDAESQATENIVMYCSAQGDVFYRRQGDSAFTKLVAPRFTSPPFAVEYRLYGEDVIILCSETDRMVVWNGVDDAYSVPDSPFVTSLTMHYERMFVTIAGQQSAVWFSDDLDPTNWNPELDEAGFIELLDERGRCLKAVSFNNYVYIFRDYGISRLSAFADQSDFSVTSLFVSSGRIYPDTVAVCGDVILFLASDGFYSFDGLSTRKILTNLTGLVCEGGHPVACWQGGQYRVAFRARTGEDTPLGENNCLLTWDRHSGAYSLMRGADVRALCPVVTESDETLYAVLADGRVGICEKCGTLFGAPLKKIWQSGLTDLGHPDRSKRIAEMFVDTTDDILLTVRTEYKARTFAVKGSAACRRIRVNMTGTKVGFTIESMQAYASIARPAVRFALLR